MQDDKKRPILNPKYIDIVTVCVCMCACVCVSTGVQTSTYIQNGGFPPTTPSPNSADNTDTEAVGKDGTEIPRRQTLSERVLHPRGVFNVPL